MEPVELSLALVAKGRSTDESARSADPRLRREAPRGIAAIGVLNSRSLGTLVVHLSSALALHGVSPFNWHLANHLRQL